MRPRVGGSHVAYEATLVIPVLNQRRSWLRQCVVSACTQTARVETIVVTSPLTRASTLRDLHGLSLRYGGMRILPEERNGFAAALNTGIHAASAERVGFLLSDDWLDSRAVEQCVGHEADIVSTGLRGVADDGVQILDQVSRTPSLDEFRSLPSLERQASYLQHFLLFKKRALREVGGVDEQVGLTGPDDFDMIWTLLERGASVAIVAEQLYNYRDHSGERLSLRSVEAQVDDLRKILDKHGVHGAERAKIIAWHSAAFGLPCHLSVDRRAGLEPPGGQCPSLSVGP